MTICLCSMLSFCWLYKPFSWWNNIFWLVKTQFLTLSHHSCRWDRATSQCLLIKPPWIHHFCTVKSPLFGCSQHVLLAGHSACAGGDALPGAWAKNAAVDVSWPCRSCVFLLFRRKMGKTCGLNGGWSVRSFTKRLNAEFTREQWRIKMDYPLVN